MEEPKERKCIICLKELPLDRELTCSKSCAKRYRDIGRNIIRIINFKNKKRCIICNLELSLDTLTYCPRCSETYIRIKNHLLKVREPTI